MQQHISIIIIRDCRTWSSNINKRFWHHIRVIVVTFISPSIDYKIENLPKIISYCYLFGCGFILGETILTMILKYTKNMRTCDSFFFKYSKHLLYHSPSHAQKGTFKLQCVHFKITWKQAKVVESKLFARRLCIITANILHVI